MQKRSPSTQELVNYIRDHLSVLDSVGRSHRQKKIINSISPSFLGGQMNHLLASPSNNNSIVSEESPQDPDELERYPRSLFRQIRSLDSAGAVMAIVYDYFQYELDSAKRYGKVGGFIEALGLIKDCCSDASDVEQKIENLIKSLREVLSDFEKIKSQHPKDKVLHQEEFKKVEDFIELANKMSDEIKRVLEHVDQKSPKYKAYKTTEKMRKSSTNLASTLDAEVHFDVDFGASHESKVIEILAKILTWLKNNESKRPKEPVNRRLNLEFESVDGNKENRFSSKK